MNGTRILDQVTLSPQGVWTPSPPGGGVADVAVIVPRGVGPVGMEVDGRLVGILGSGQVSSIQRVSTALTLQLMAPGGGAAPTIAGPMALVQGTQWPAGCEPAPPMQQAVAPPLTVVTQVGQRTTVLAGSGPSVIAAFAPIPSVGATGAGALHLTSGMAAGTVGFLSASMGGLYREATYGGTPLDVPLGADEVTAFFEGDMTILLPSNATGAGGAATVRFPLQL